MRKHLCYMLLQLKSAFRYIPGLFAGTLLFGFLTFLTAFACLNSSDTQTKLFFKIAVVLPSDDTLVNLGFNMLTQMESLKDYCEFIQTDHATAETMLKKGEVYGIVYIPEGFVEDVLNGQNTPARIILPDNPGIETSLFRSVLNAGSDTLAYVQSGIYALSDTYNHFGLSDKIAAATDELNDYYIRFRYTILHLQRSCHNNYIVRISSRKFYYRRKQADRKYVNALRNRQHLYLWVPYFCHQHIVLRPADWYNVYRFINSSSCTRRII